MKGKSRLRDFTKSRKMVAKINRLVDQEVAIELLTLDRECADCRVGFFMSIIDINNNGSAETHEPS